jgi:hypothetical protein
VDAILIVEGKCLTRQYYERDTRRGGRRAETSGSNGSKRGGVDYAVVNEDRHQARNFTGRELKLT